MARNKKKPFYENVIITDIGAEGNAVGRVGEKVLFTKLAIPGDVVNLQVTKKRKRFEEAFVSEFIEYSNDRIDAFCTHFGICGGCKWQMLPYGKQLYYKQKQVEDQLKRIGKVQLSEIQPIIGSERNTFYRNKLEFTFSNKRWLTFEEIKEGGEITRNDALGFHVPGSFDKVINIEECWLQPEPSNQIRNCIYKYAIEHDFRFFDIKEQRGFLRTMIVRTTSIGELMVILSFYHEDVERRMGLMKTVLENFPQITSFMYVINAKGNDTITDQEIELFSGRDHILEEMEGLRFKIGPKSFYQTNSEQAYNLYKVVRDFANLDGSEIVYDLYTGTGTIANFVAGKAKKVVGIEYVMEAIADAKVNSEINHIENTSFFAGDIKDLLNDEFVKKNGQPDVLITDPPRAGMHASVVGTIVAMKPKRIVYVSCNPATQARDLALMDEFYQIEKIQPVDMFPHTHHVENVVLLNLKA